MYHKNIKIALNFIHMYVIASFDPKNVLKLMHATDEYD